MPCFALGLLLLHAQCIAYNDTVHHTLSEFSGNLILILFRITMDFVENLRIGEERTQAGVGAEKDHPPVVPGTRKVGRVRIAEDASAQGDELAGMGSLFTKFRIGYIGH